jgi:hypothetical protein
MVRRVLLLGLALLTFDAAAAADHLTSSGGVLEGGTQMSALGDTLLEAYWKSVAMPGQGLFIGEPLAHAYGAL